MEVGERQLLGPEIVQQTNEKIKVIQEKIKAAQSWQKSYANNQIRDLEFQIGDKAYLKISHQGNKRGKLSPWGRMGFWDAFGQ